MLARRKQRKRPAGLAAALAAATALLAPAAPAFAEVRSGSATDPAEYSRPAGRDILAVSASYDTEAGTLTAAVTTRGAPTTASTYLLTRFSASASGECGRPMAFLGAAYQAGTANWLTEGPQGEQSPELPAEKSVSGTTTTLRASAPQLAGQPYACFNAFVLDEDEVEGPDYLASAVPLNAPSAPPQPAPDPAPQAPPAPPAPPAKAAALAFGALGEQTLRRGAWKRVRISISNPGNAAAGNVRLRIGRAKGVAVKPKAGTLRLKSIGAAKTKVVSLRVKLTRRAKALSRLPLEATGKGLRARARLVLRAGRKPVKKPPPPGQPASGKSPLAETIFYRYSSISVSESASLEGFAIVDGKWAHTGIPAGGLPSCTAVTGSAEAEGCVRYSYDPKSGAIGIGSQRGTITREGNLEIDGALYFRLVTPAPGSRYAVEQSNIGFSGYCGFVTGCTTWHLYMTLTSSGEFVYSSSTLATLGGSGPGETYVASGNFSPDEHGHYSVEKGARIRLAYDSGKVETRTFALLRDDAGQPDPVNSGFILDDTYFTFAKD